MPIDVLCALDPADRGQDLAARLEHCAVTIVDAGPDAVAEALRGRGHDLVVVSTALLTPPVEERVDELRGRSDAPEVVLVHDHEDPVFRAAAIRAGCLAVLNASLSLDDLAATLQALVQRSLNHVRLAIRATSPQGPSRLDDFVSESPRMAEFLALARRVVDADSALLLLGETGTGKERLARSIHGEGPRGGGPFVAVNCGALPETLLESELFGHERGAFTGAERARRGYFEQAEGGTLFLDEIGEVPSHLQVKLLRAIEHRKIQRLGAEREFPVDVRVMAATNRDLEQEIEARRFRRDLYYRLAVVTLTLPALRECPEDVPVLFNSYVEHFRRRLNRPICGVQPAAADALARYPWPGNVRELINVVERAVLLAPGPEIRLADLPRVIGACASADAVATVTPESAVDPWTDRPLAEARREAIASFERAYLTRLLRSTGGRVGETATRAGIDPRSLYELMRRHGLRKEDFRDHRR